MVSNFPIHKIFKYLDSFLKWINAQSGTWLAVLVRGTWLDRARQDEAWVVVRRQKLRIEKRDRDRGDWSRRDINRGHYVVGLGCNEVVQDRSDAGQN